MTITYNGNRHILYFLSRWRGSVWKSVWFELMIFLIAYYIIRIIIEFWIFACTSDESEHCNKNNHTVAIEIVKAVLVFNEWTKQVPLTFLLGFYISEVMKRWWNQFESITWSEDLVSYVCAIFSDDTPQNIKARHTIARYLNLTTVLCWREISVKVRSRFPLTKNLVKSGLMTEKEMQLYEECPIEAVRWQLPIEWITRMVEVHVKKETLPIYAPNTILTELKNFRQQQRKLFCYDWVGIPLVYTQVVAISVYGYFLFCLIGRQSVAPSVYKLPFSLPVEFMMDLYFPFSTVLQFLFYVGWFKVGHSLLQPFGTDDDDLELNYILDRNVAATFAICHGAHKQCPYNIDEENITDKLIDLVKADGSGIVTIPHTKLSSVLEDNVPVLNTVLHVHNLDEDNEMLEIDEDCTPIFTPITTTPEKIVSQPPSDTSLVESVQQQPTTQPNALVKFFKKAIIFGRAGKISKRCRHF